MNYEQKYKEALERARKELQECVHKDCDDNVRRTVITLIHNLFPELKESEDERIRKEIINFLKDFEKDHYRSVNFSSWIAWLEKQGEKESDPRYKYLEDLLTADDIHQMSVNDAMVEEAKTKAIEAISNIGIFELLGLEKQSEQPINNVELKFKVGDWS